ncbi:MAG: FprA family A-type flavoprotein [Lentisphaeria bacterium]|nr:FprA family A-type flavoprotein [Lentisphaeria bacterium]
MKDYLKAVQISEKVYYVGAIDWNVRSFHGYRTGRGTSYNAFLIIDEKVTLIDCVKKPFFNELMARIASVIDPSEIDYIVSNHSEPDHSGCLVDVVNAVKPEKVFASVMGEKALKAYYGEDFEVTPLKTGDVLDLGENKLSVLETRMLHWPDSMVAYLDKDKVLFSQDAFGMHYATANLFADENDYSVMTYEAKKYFANILMHLTNQVRGAIKQLGELNLDVKILAPDHGPLFRTPESIAFIQNLYAAMASGDRGRKAVVFYATMWGSTEKIATALADGIRSAGVEVKVSAIGASDRSDIMTDVLDAGLVCVGSPTMNNQMYPSVADVLTYLKGLLRTTNKIGYAFGSFGWSGEAPKKIQAELESMKFELPFEQKSTKYNPFAEDLAEYFEQGAALGKMLLESGK